MTETHTPYQRGRRAAERGAPKEVPLDLSARSGSDSIAQRLEWIDGYNSIHGTDVTRSAPENGPTITVSIEDIPGIELEGVPFSEIKVNERGAHYKAGQFQAWDVTRYLSGDMAQAWQYVYRCGRKGTPQDAITDLRKACDFIADWLAHDPEPNQRASTGDIPDEVFFTLDQWRLLALNDIQYADHQGASDTAERAIKGIKREIARREAGNG